MANDRNEYDVVVVGAGPNGLACASYLSRAGARVALLERNVETGGGLVTEELSGFKLTYHATYLLLAEELPPYRDLGLAAEGVAFLRPDVQVAFLLDEGQTLLLHRDPERTLASVGELAPSDVERFQVLLDEFRAMCDRILVPATYAPPLSPIDQMTAFEESDALGRRLGEISDLTPREVIASYGIDDSRLRGALLYLSSAFGLDPDEGGVGFLTPLYVCRGMNAALVRGGTHQLASTLRRMLEQGGGTVRTGTAAARWIFDPEGRVAGVGTEDGSELRARAVVSTLNPVQTFLDLVRDQDQARIPADLLEVARAWQWEEVSLFVALRGIVGAPPSYPGRPAAVSRALSVVMGLRDEDDVLEHFRAVREGGLPDHPIAQGTCPSLFDPLLVPDHVPYGPHHVLRIECLAPYAGGWEDRSRKAAFGNGLLDLWAKHAPCIARGNVRARSDWSPLDIEQHLTTMHRGSIKHGAYLSLQLGYNRPSPDCSAYRTPVAGLYLGGASVHPGGMVTFGPGTNAARVVAGDLGLESHWDEPEMVREARGRGYLGFAEDADPPHPGPGG
ncbi:MAG: phytoene desaturase family protein [Myxococcota bacterium]